jgi:hypothetical protein
MNAMRHTFQHMSRHRRFRQLVRLIALVILGGFLFAAMPCASVHDDDHREAEAVCVCTCCEAPVGVTTHHPHPVISPMPVTSRLDFTDELFCIRDIALSIFQPPEA